MKKKTDIYYNEHDQSQVYEVLKKKKKSRLKQKWRIFLIVIMIAGILLFIQSDFSKVRSIEIQGNQLMSETLIKDHLNIDEESFIFNAWPSTLEKRLKNNSLIEEVHVRTIPFIGVKVTVKEANIIAYMEQGSQYILVGSNGKTLTVEKEKYTSFVQNYILLRQFSVDDTFNQFTEALAKVDEDVLYQISDIVFVPEKTDPTKLEFMMDDGKRLYLRIEDMVEELKSYNQVISTYPNGCYYDFLGRKVYVKECE